MKFFSRFSPLSIFSSSYLLTLAFLLLILKVGLTIESLIVAPYLHSQILCLVVLIFVLIVVYNRADSCCVAWAEGYL